MRKVTTAKKPNQKTVQPVRDQVASPARSASIGTNSPMMDRAVAPARSVQSSHFSARSRTFSPVQDALARRMRLFREPSTQRSSGLFSSLEDVIEIANNRILAMPGVRHVETSIAVSTLKYDFRVAKIIDRKREA